MERQSKGSRGLEAYCKGGQGPPRAVEPLKKNTDVLDYIYIYIFKYIYIYIYISALVGM